MPFERFSDGSNPYHYSTLEYTLKFSGAPTTNPLTNISALGTSPVSQQNKAGLQSFSER